MASKNSPYIHTSDIHNTHAAEEILPFLFRHVKHESVIDVGCGLGTWLKTARALGTRHILGVDGEHLDKSKLVIGEEDLVTTDLREPLLIEHRFDLIISLEVAEHLPESSADTFIESLQGLGDRVLFAAAIPGQGGQNHLNEQWHKYWISRFANHGFKLYDIIRPAFWNNPRVEWWYKQNMLFFSREAIPEFQETKELDSWVHPELFKAIATEKGRLYMEAMSAEQELRQLKTGQRGLKEPFKYLCRALNHRISRKN